MFLKEEVIKRSSRVIYKYRREMGGREYVGITGFFEDFFGGFEVILILV